MQLAVRDIGQLTYIGRLARRPIRGRPIRGRPIRGRPIRGRPIRGGPIRGRPIRRRSGPRILPGLAENDHGVRQNRGSAEQEEAGHGGWGHGRRRRDRDRHHGAAFGPDLELLAGRQGQLRRGPDGRGSDRRRAARDRGHRPGLPGVPRAGRAVPGRRRRIRQFLDIGTGLPTANNTHEVAQRIAPSAVEPGGADAVHAAQPGADRRVLRRTGDGRAGLVPCPRWRPDPGDAAGARDMDEYCGLGRK